MSTTQLQNIEDYLFRNLPTIGFPILPHKKNTLFPNNYLDFNNQLLAEREEELACIGRTLELHYQSVEEFESLSDDDKKEIKATVNRLRGRGFKFMIHHPFLYQKGDGVFNMDFAWHTVPQKYRDEGNFVCKIAKDNNLAREISMDVSKRFLDYCGFLGIENVTIHATKPVAKLDYFFNEADFADYMAKMGELTDHIQRQGLPVKIGVETGGITLPQLLRLNKEVGTLINYDLAHYFLDLRVLQPELTNYERNVQVVKAFKENRRIIRQLHFTQAPGWDAHQPIHKKGPLSVGNIGVLSVMQDDLANLGKDYLAMVESAYSNLDAEVVKHDLDGKTIFLGAGEATVNVIFGNSASGNSTTTSVLEDKIGRVFCSNHERVHIKGAMSPDTVVPESEKEKVYQELYARLKVGLKIGDPRTNIEATFHLRSRRDAVYQLLREHPAKEVYLWHQTCSEEDRKKRLDARARERKFVVDQKGEYPSNVLTSFDLYQQYMNPDSGEKPTPFSPSEVPLDLRERVHVVTYDTSKSTLKIVNPDDTTRAGVAKLIVNARDKGYGALHGEVISWDELA